MSKHNEILNYIRELPEGTKISVRQISANLNVSDGTSYRAIKFAEKEGLVKTIERVGTIRVASKESTREEKLTFKQVNNVIGGTVLAGGQGMDKEISRFIIGAMKTDALVTYLEESALLIVGNRENVQLKAMETRSGILITGGFDTNKEILDKADELSLPVISTDSDTFSVASIIQRELYSLSLMMNIVTAGDLAVKQEEYVYDLLKDSARVYQPGDKITVLLHDGEYIGTIRSSDFENITSGRYKEWLMSGVAEPSSSTLQRLRQVMSWHQLNIVPIVDEENQYMGIVHRREVFRQMEAKKLSTGMSAEEVIDREIRIDDNRIYINVLPFMTDEYGSITQSAYMRLVERLIGAVLENYDIHSYHLDSMNLMNIKLVQLNQDIVLEGNVIDLGDQFLRLETVTTSNGEIFSKAMLMIQYYRER